MRTRVRKGILFITGLVLGILFLSPLYILIANSFKTQKGIYQNIMGFPTEQTFTWNNYPEAWEKLSFLTSFGNSLLISVTATLLLVACSSMAAWALVRYKGRVSNFLFLFFAVAMLIPFQCVMLPLINLMGKINLLNRPGLIFMYLGFGSSLSIVLFHGFIKNIPLELEEAATIDGCGIFRLFWAIVFPLLRTIAITVAVLNVMWIWNDFLLPQLVINKVGWQTLPLKTYLFFGQFSKRWDLATAGLILGMLPIVVFYLFAQKHIVKGVTEGAIK